MNRSAAARPDTIRAHNLAMLLQEVHRAGECTRSDLTRRLSLSRSTIGALVADLCELRLVEERVPTGGSRAGRPSHVVAPRPDGPYAVAVDVDVTRVCTAAVGLGGQVLARHDVPTRPAPPDPQTVVQIVVEAAQRLERLVPPDAWPIGIGVSVPGTVGRHDALIEFAPNLAWRHEPFGALLSARTPELPVAVGNDADVAVLAEHLRGAARGTDDVVYLMARVGVGAGVIVNGSPLRGRDGHAGEVGHNVMDSSGPRCHCGKRGCVETYIGDKALLKLAGRRRPPTLEAVAAVLADARAGDPCAIEAVRTVARGLGATIGALVNVLNPELVVLGGSLTGVLELAGDEVDKAMDGYAMTTARQPVRLAAPGLGTDSSLLGAAELAFAQLLADPTRREARRR
ncbi:MAG: ROK family transcriptional regulator [Jatrophihabitans sp.]|nr:MAG: ROK family transcriptional regulator [Jatrophihabitans sp.]